MTMRLEKGFTLIEIIASLVMISAGIVGLARLFSNANSAATVSEEMQKATRYAQECAEHILGLRADTNFLSSTISTTMCNTLSIPAADSAYVRTVSLGSTYVGTAATSCPNTASCRDAAVRVQTANVSAVLNVLLVE
jgi:prepilin-type N-terminal cleavage/methylation domain-containing protein